MPYQGIVLGSLNRSFAGVVLGATGAVLAGCVGLSASVQSPREAADAATQFGQYAFVEGDTERAYLMLAPEIAREISSDELAAQLLEMHADARPGSIRATEYEPILGERGMSIYLRGIQGDQIFYYRVVVQGGSTAGYRVLGLFRGSGPYPPSQRQPLP